MTILEKFKQEKLKTSFSEGALVLLGINLEPYQTRLSGEEKFVKEHYHHIFLEYFNDGLKFLGKEKITENDFNTREKARKQIDTMIDVIKKKFNV